MNVFPIDDQPISATHFGEGKWLTEFITPNNMEVMTLYESLTKGLATLDQKIAACQKWVSEEVRYVEFVRSELKIEGKTSVNTDTWLSPSIIKNIKVGNCANKSFLLASLLRNAMSAEDVHCVLGNLHNGAVGGHAWVEVVVNEEVYVSETTMPGLHPMIPLNIATRYEPVHYFNDIEAYAIEGRTIMEPFSSYDSTWLKDYLDWAYIKGVR